MRERSNAGLIWAVSIALLYVAVWAWCKLTGAKPEMES